MKNTPSHFKTQLPVNINLGESNNTWEVACVEMSFVNAIKTLPTNQSIEIFQLIDPTAKTITVRHCFKKGVDMKTAIGKKEKFLFAEINSESGAIEGFSHSDFKLSYQESTDRFSITRTNMKVRKIFLNNYTAFLLGFTKNKIIPEQEKFYKHSRNYRGTAIRFTEGAVTRTAGQSPRVTQLVSPEGLPAHVLILNEENSDTPPNIVFKLKKVTTGDKRKISLQKLTVPQGYYKSPQHLTQTLNKMLSRKKLGFSFQVNEDINRVICKYNRQVTAETERSIYMSPTLAWVLGFDTETEFSVLTSKEGKNPPDLRRGIYSFYVYCDLCTEVCVGDSLVPLLRTVSYNAADYGEHVTVLYSNPIYVPLNKHYISCIEVKVCDDSGEVVPFVEGKTVLTLHFRKFKT